MKFKYLLPIGVLAVTLTACNTNGNRNLSKEVGDITLDIIEINDLHGYVNNASKNDGYDLSNISYYVNTKRKTKDNEVILIGNGDMFEGTAFSNLSQGLSTVTVMNEMNFDMMGIGNHEFSWGLDTILNYFDGNKSNGEANFPLINGNVYKDDKRYGEEDENDIILPYTTVERAGYKIGILSYIGDVASSISSSKLIEFSIKASNQFFQKQVSADAKALKKEGCDFIIFNVHGGDADNINNYSVNKIVANLKDDSNNYLIDAVINGHTHSKQAGSIKRDNGADLPLVQGGSYCDSFGEIELVISSKEKKVVKSSSYYVQAKELKKSSKEETVKSVIDTEYEKIQTTLQKSYGNNPKSISRASLGNLFAKEMRKATSSDISIMNTGGIRTELKAGEITFEKIYEVYPFENHIICLNAKGSDLNDWIETQNSYYYMDYVIDSTYDKPFDDDKYYKVSTIDYVYDSSYFKDTIKNYTYVSSSNITTPRDYFISDLENRNESSFNINGEIKVAVKPFGELE